MIFNKDKGKEVEIKKDRTVEALFRVRLVSNQRNLYTVIQNEVIKRRDAERKANNIALLHTSLKRELKSKIEQISILTNEVKSLSEFKQKAILQHNNNELHINILEQIKYTIRN